MSNLIFVSSKVPFATLRSEESSYKMISKNAETVVRKYFSDAVTQRCSAIKGVFGNFAKFIKKHPSQSFLINKVAGLSLQLYLKKDSGTGVSL